MTKAMVEFFPGYKDGTPGNNGWDIKRQIFDWVVPYHDGAIRLFKELGVWKPGHQANNDKLLKRQDVLAKAWDGYHKGGPSDENAFYAGWLKARAAALTQAGFDPVVTE